MIVGVPSCCSSMLIRKDFCLTRHELHLWMSMFGMGAAALGRWGTHCTVTDLQRGGGGKTVASG